MDIHMCMDINIHMYIHLCVFTQLNQYCGIELNHHSVDLLNPQDIISNIRNNGIMLLLSVLHLTLHHSVVNPQKSCNKVKYKKKKKKNEFTLDTLAS